MQPTRIRPNCEAHRAPTKAFIELMESVSRREGLSSGEVMRRWLEAAYRCIAGSMLRGEAWSKNEDAYLRIVRALRFPRETRSCLTSMLGQATIALLAEPIDFIGPIFTEVAASAGMGQFFTPHHLSRLIASCTITDPSEMMRASGRPFLLLQEPACGVGGMALAANQVLAEHGLDISTEAHWVMVDVDVHALHAAYIQMVLTGASAEVVHGNTLSLEVLTRTPTPAAVRLSRSALMAEAA